MNHINRILLMVFLFANVALSGDAVKTLETKALELVAQFPADSISERDQLAAGIMQLGPRGIARICAMLTPSERGDNSRVQFALDGLSMYVHRAGAETERVMYSKTLIKALESNPPVEVAAFLISQVQLVGRNEAVKPLSNFLQHDPLCEPAARALVAIGTPAAETALLKSLDPGHAPTLITLINGLGQLRSRKAAAKIAPFASSEDSRLRQVACDALANIGHPSSAELLGTVALASTSFERTTAAARYLLYARRLGENGRNELGAAMCHSVMKNYTAPHESGIQCAALSALVAVTGKNAFPDLLAAMDSDCKDVRCHALELAGAITGPDATARWLEKLAAVDGERKAEMIAMLGDRGDASALPAVRDALRDDDAIIRVAAIPAASKLGRSQIIQDLIPVLKNNAPNEVAAVKSALLRLDAAPAVTASANALLDMPTLARVALLEILAERRAMDRADLVFAQTACPNDTIRLAAITAMQRLATERDLPRLTDLLLAVSDSADIQMAHDAVVTAALQIEGKEERSALLRDRLQQAPTELRPRLILPLARLGGEAALNLVIQETRSKHANHRTAAIDALADWPEFPATPELLYLIRTAKTPAHRTRAVSGYVRLVKTSELTSDIKLAMLRDALSSVNSTDDKAIVLRGLAEIPTAEALELVAGFFGDSALCDQAAFAAERIALPGPFSAGLRSPAIVTTLKQAAHLIQSNYEQERIEKYTREILGQSGFVPLFNGKDLTGWKGLVGDPKARAEMSPEELAKKQVEADSVMREHWKVVAGILEFDGHGHSLCTAKDYADFEMFVDWKIGKFGDSGIYLRGSPQVQIWDPAQWPEGSGGLYNNQVHPGKPLRCADNPIGEWNTFRIKMIGERVTVHLNGVLVVDNVVMENYWERDTPIYPVGQIELQAHNSQLFFREIYIREILPEGGVTELSAQEKAEGFVQLFNGSDLTGWVGDTSGYSVRDGKIIIYPDKGGNLFTAGEYDNFIFRFEFKLTPGANNGLGIRAPLQGDAAYVGMELQILDNTAPVYKDLQPYQYHGSIYGVVPARREFLNPVGEWNSQEVIADGRNITVKLNGAIIVDANIDEASKNGTPDNRDHPGLNRSSGHIGFLGHGAYLEFRNIRIRELK
ncbi:MAG: family 16 glycoside hydrolase [Candidatus Zhuqueibacterota bacterium]